MQKMKTFLFQKFYSVHFWHFFSAFDQSLLLYSEFQEFSCICIYLRTKNFWGKCINSNISKTNEQTMQNPIRIYFFTPTQRFMENYHSMEHFIIPLKRNFQMIFNLVIGMFLDDYKSQAPGTTYIVRVGFGEHVGGSARMLP